MLRVSSLERVLRFSLIGVAKANPIERVRYNGKAPLSGGRETGFGGGRLSRKRLLWRDAFD